MVQISLEPWNLTCMDIPCAINISLHAVPNMRPQPDAYFGMCNGIGKWPRFLAQEW